MESHETESIAPNSHDLTSSIIAREEPLPSWLAKTVEKLDDLARLPVNWDSYGAPRIRSSSLRAAIEFLARTTDEDTPPPAVVPTNRGHVMLEWHTKGIDLEIEVVSATLVRASFEDAADGAAWESEVGTDSLELMRCIRLLSLKDRAKP